MHIVDGSKIRLNSAAPLRQRSPEAFAIEDALLRDLGLYFAYAQKIGRETAERGTCTCHNT